MNCPYCQSEVHADAVVCKTCHRDFYLVKPMMEKVAALEKQLAEMPDIAPQLARIAELEHQLAEGNATPPPQPAQSEGGSFADSMAYLVLPLLLLLAAHALITVVFDLNILYLRVISIVLPMPFGFLLFRKHARRMLPWFLGVIALALASVIGMSGITSLVDGTPVMPQNNFEWREVIEYSASIAFSFLTGFRGARAVFPDRRRQGVAGKAAHAHEKASGIRRDDRRAGHDGLFNLHGSQALSLMLAKSLVDSVLKAPQSR